MKALLIPEVVQSSALDCGPAALKSLLEGFGIPISYGRLREACQTDLDGTSIDTIEVVANQLGLAAEQVMVPLDHLLLPEAKNLPALLVVQLPDGMSHFVVVWAKYGKLLQVMDPAVGRRWVTADRFLRDVYQHRMAVPAEAWRDFAGSAEFQTALRVRMRAAGVSRSDIERFCAAALGIESWNGVATLDAAVRLLQSLRSAKGVTRSKEALRVLERLQQRPEMIPTAYWSVRSAAPDEDGAEQLFMSGAVLLRARGKRTELAAEGPLCAEVVAAATEKPLRPVRELARNVAECGIGSLILFLGGTVISSAGVLVEAFLFRSLLDITAQLHMAGDRAAGMTAVLLVSLALLVIDICLLAAMLRLGRSMETRLRIAFLRKLPKLGDRYFQSRLTSDMAERSHLTHQLRKIPSLCRRFAGAALKLCFTAAALVWLEPSSWVTVLLLASAALALPLLAQPLLADQDLRVRSHSGALTRYVLDALRGLVAIRAHGAERKLRSEQEKLLGSWGSAALRLQTTAVQIEAVQLAVMFGLAILLLLRHPVHGLEAGRALLAIYWLLNLPAYGQEMLAVARSLPYYRSLALRLLEPLGAPEEGQTVPAISPVLNASTRIHFRKVSVVASGHRILKDVELLIERGSHVAIVGQSGAGKSSLLSVLLGWWKASEGIVELDGLPLDCERLRRSTVWVDPTVQVWNRSLFSNIEYGSKADPAKVAAAVDAALLRNVLESLPDGLQTNLGEGGAFLSGGEGQRVRVARAMARGEVRLVLLDEPFRGLDREKRWELLSRARKLWREATLVCVTHDISETAAFDQVAVVEGGSIAEQGHPRELAANSGSRYAQLLRAERRARAVLWGDSNWRRLRVQSGRIVETIRDASRLAEEEVA